MKKYESPQINFNDLKLFESIAGTKECFECAKVIVKGIKDPVTDGENSGENPPGGIINTVIPITTSGGNKCGSGGDVLVKGLEKYAPGFDWTKYLLENYITGGSLNSAANINPNNYFSGSNS